MRICARRPALAQTHGLDAYDDYDAALARAEADIVSVCVPVNLHRAVAESALRAGCHVLLEKPIAGTLEDARAIADAARASGRKLVVGYQYHGFFGYAKLRELLQEEPLAGPWFMRCSDVREVRPKLAMHRRSANGGPIVDMCGHLFDMARHLFGAEPREVYARGHVAGAGRPRLAEVADPAIDAAEILVDFTGGHVLSVFVNWGMPENFPTMASVALVGPRFHAEVETNHLRLTTAAGRREWTAPTDTAGPASRMQDLIGSIERDTDPEVSAAEATRALEVSLAALRSIETGRPVPVPHEQTSDDPAAPMTKTKIAHLEELGARVVREIRLGQACSRFALANRLRLAPSTVGIYVDRLVTDGYLAEAAVGRSERRGRPAQRLRLSAEAGCFVGAEFEAENIYAVGVDFSGAMIARHAVALPPRTSAEDVLAGLRTAIEQVMKQCRLPPLGIGVGVPGLVDAERGVALDYRFIKGWTNIPISRRLRERFKLPIRLENNARAAAMGHLLFDPAGHAGDFVCLLVRSGVGAGIVRDGQLHGGHDGLAGEVRRIQLAQAGGATVEDAASVRAVTGFVRAELRRGVVSAMKDRPRRLTIRDVIAAAQAGDALARESIQRAVSGLGWLAHVLTLVTNPQTIILTGPLNALGDWLRLEVQAALNRHTTAARTAHPVIALSGISENAGALGAASLAIEAWRPVHRV